MKNWNLDKSLIAGGLLLIVLLAVFSNHKAPLNLTWHHHDKEAFGGYVLHQLLPEYRQGPVNPRYHTIYESRQMDSLHRGNLLLIAANLNMDPEDWQALTEHVARGNTALLAAHKFSDLIADSLNLQIEPYNTTWLSSENPFILFQRRLGLRFKNLPSFPQKDYELEAQVANYQLEDLRQDTSLPYVALAGNDEGEDVLRSYPVGKGQILVSSTPMLFTNYYLMKDTARAFAQGVFSLLGQAPRTWHYQYYHLGRLEDATPLRYVLRQPQLKAALYLTLAGVLLFLIFGSKRRQRPIPVIEPPKNHSLEFLRTLAGLHYRTSNHQGLAKKRLDFFRDFVFRHYRIRLQATENAQQELKAKSNARPELVERLVAWLDADLSSVGKEDLLRLEKDLNEFYQTNT